MWRAFFYGLGTTLILLGAQCLVVDHIVVADSRRVPSLVARILDKIPQEQSKPFSSTPNRSEQSVWGKPGFTVAQESQFGPSRFESPYNNSNSSNNQLFGQQAGFGGAFPNQQNQWSQQGNPPFSLAGYNGTTDTNSGAFGQKNPGASSTTGSSKAQIIKHKDWMPWFLLAVGTLVVLYTNSTSRKFSND